jgi:monoamine oxidase
VVEEFRAFVPAMRDDLRRLGEPTAAEFYEWQGLMEGAALSGLRAAGEVYALVRGK